MSWKGWVWLLGLGMAPTEVVVVVDDQGRHYAGSAEVGEARTLVSIRDPLVIGEDADRRVRMWPLSWSDWVEEMHVRAARYWKAGPKTETVYRENLARLKAEYDRTRRDA